MEQQRRVVAAERAFVGMLRELDGPMKVRVDSRFGATVAGMDLAAVEGQVTQERQRELFEEYRLEVGPLQWDSLW